MTANVDETGSLFKSIGDGVSRSAVVLRLPRRASRYACRIDPDPYMLVVLAQEERNDNRIEQSEQLIEAAYKYYDRRGQ